MHHISCSCNRGRMIWSLQRGWSLLGEVVNRSFTVQGKWPKVIPINNSKKYVPGPAEISSACVIAEEDKEMEQHKSVLDAEQCSDFDSGTLERVLEKFKTLFRDKPRLCNVGV